MFRTVSEWLDVALETPVPDEVAAFGFNLYEDGDCDWSMEFIGASEFDPDNEDWLCSEVTDFGTRDKPLRWHREAGWEEVKAKSGVGVGFVDGNIEILYAKTDGQYGDS